MNRNFKIAVLLCVLFIIVSGCQQKGKQNVPEENMTAGHAVIGTSDAIFHMAWKLSSAFQASTPTAFVDIVRNDNRSLVDSLLNGKAEEIFLDRALAREESLALLKADFKIYTYPIAYYPVYLLNAKDNPVSNIDSLKLRNILGGVIKNWRDLGGEDLKLTPYLPLPGEGAWESLMQYFGRLDSVDARICSTATQMLELAKDDKGALLVYALPYEDLPYKRLTLEREGYQIPANVETIIEAPTYPFKLNITYVTVRNKLDVAAGYLTFAMGNVGQREAMRLGYRPAAVPVRIVKMKNQE
jgi:phosphate transport system substrate-binding protein